MANTRKQHALAGMGKARAGMGKACALEGHAQVGARRAQVRKRYAHTKGFVTLVFGDVDLCCRLCLSKMHNAQSQGDCMCFVFFGFESTQIARQLQQERTQMDVH